MGPDPAAEAAAHAKVNLALAVRGRRPDGYHELRSVFLRLELADTLTLSDMTDPGAVDGLVIEGDPDCPVADNLVLRAVGGFRAAAADGDLVVPSLRIGLVKRIPMAAGLGGGSTDAATMLRLLVAGHREVGMAVDLGALAARLGADVPFFLDGAGAALVSGAGEIVEPLPPPIDAVGVLLLTPPVGASTPQVFRAWDELLPRGPSAEEAAAIVDDLAHLLRSGMTAATLVAFADRLREANDLWLPATAVTPGLDTLRDLLEGRLGRPVLLTGSGSTLFALYPSASEADVIASQVRADPRFAGVRITATRSTGPHASVINDWRDS